MGLKSLDKQHTQVACAGAQPALDVSIHLGSVEAKKIGKGASIPKGESLPPSKRWDIVGRGVLIDFRQEAED